MNTITVLLVTIWLTVPGSVGGHAGTARVLIAPDHEACVKDSPAILASIKKAGLDVAGQHLVIEKISGICLDFAEPKDV